jgi:ATP-dependent DNA helicase RecG
MDENTLYELLEGLEWNDLEFKESKTKVPDSAYESVSAFLNTQGGHIVLGVNDKREIVGVLDADKIQGDFIGELQNPVRFGTPVSFEEYLKQHEDKNVLVFYIPEARRQDKPVYVKTKKGRAAYIRKGGGDYGCSKLDLDRMISDAKTERPDGQLLDLDPDTSLDQNSIRWFRHRYEGKGGNKPLIHLSDNDFLVELGLLVEHKGSVLPTFASVLLLGKTSRVRQMMPRPIVDCLRYSFPLDHANTGKRWDKRITCEFNIVESWKAIVEWYNTFADVPFNVDKETGQRTDSPPDFIAFRESVINLLSHQDFTDQTRWPVIENFSDQTRFWNPGDAFASADKLLEPGSKEVRNPIIVRALRDIGFSEQSGWGLREVYRNWHELGRVPPLLSNNKEEKTFELKLIRKILMSEQQVLLQSQIGINLKPEEASAFANLCAAENTEMTLSALRAALGLNSADTSKIVKRLLIQGVVIQSRDKHLALAEHLKPLRDKLLGIEGDETEQADNKATDLSTEQVDGKATDLSTEQVEPLTSLSDKQKVLLAYCDVPRSMADILGHLDVGSRGYLKGKHLDPLLTHGLLTMTNPNPRASNQQYVITKMGVELSQVLDVSE